ncbi:DUF4178 domain-containing protein [Micromonospora sp. WMMD812]|uniref:DUF4178 domain-containing protein n=1 Tax=Micromonospora sp. WMMD812 TaxID=3015152 RepID=UPI00248CE5F1|nr:DUF4178 domain-containing protein [Micromonospora sp. WMMD812]WBB65634.1 DUF4178 domain-containing protein [Micromonospora sp. WMMD812]
MDGSVAYLVTTVVCLAGVAAVVLVLAAVRGSRTRTSEGVATGDGSGGAESPRDPRRLRPGDTVEIRRLSYLVRGTIRLVDGGWSWAEHLLDDPDGVPRRLSVQEHPELELVLWAAEPGVRLTPGAPILDLDGRRYSWAESGQARYTATGITGLDPTGTMRYHDYQAPGGARLSFEAYGETGWAVARGEVLHRTEVTVHPRTGEG